MHYLSDANALWGRSPRPATSGQNNKHSSEARMICMTRLLPQQYQRWVRTDASCFVRALVRFAEQCGACRKRLTYKLTVAVGRLLCRVCLFLTGTGYCCTTGAAQQCVRVPVISWKKYDAACTSCFRASFAEKPHDFNIRCAFESLIQHQERVLRVHSREIDNY